MDGLWRNTITCLNPSFPSRQTSSQTSSLKTSLMSSLRASLLTTARLRPGTSLPSGSVPSSSTMTSCGIICTTASGRILLPCRLGLRPVFLLPVVLQLLCLVGLRPVFLWWVFLKAGRFLRRKPMSLSRRNFLESLSWRGPQQQAVPAGGHSPRNLESSRFRCLYCCKRLPRRPIRHARARRSGHHLRTRSCSHLHMRMSDPDWSSKSGGRPILPGWPGCRPDGRPT